MMTEYVSVQPKRVYCRSCQEWLIDPRRAFYATKLRWEAVARCVALEHDVQVQGPQHPSGGGD